MKFITALKLDPYWGHPDEWVVRGDFIVDHNGVIYRVLGGFITDLASTPIGNVNDQSRWASVVHDWNYCVQTLERGESDDLFREMLIESGYSRFRAWVYWKAVRLWGWRYWNRRKRSGLSKSYDFVPPGYWEAHL